jgi:CPA2 family monovalent cation:H+ antiporter-2
VLIQAHVARAGMLAIATPDTFGVRKMAAAARLLNPEIEVMVRTHNEEEAALLAQEQVGKVFMGEHELALGMAGHVLARMGRTDGPAV